MTLRDRKETIPYCEYCGEENAEASPVEIRRNVFFGKDNLPNFAPYQMLVGITLDSSYSPPFGIGNSYLFPIPCLSCYKKKLSEIIKNL